MNELVTLPSQFAKFIRYLNIWLKVLNSLDSLTLSPSYSISRNFFFDLSNIDHKFENYTFASTENQDPKGHSKRKQIYLHYMPSYFVYIQSYKKNKNSPSNNFVMRADWPPLKIFLDPRLLVMSFSLPIYLSRF